MANYRKGRTYKRRRYTKKSRNGYRKKNQGYMARSGKKAPMGSRGWSNKFGLGKAKPELKFFDTEFQTAGTEMRYEGLVGGSVDIFRILACNAMAKGTDYNTRIGRKILIKSIYTRITISPRVAGTPNGNATARTLLIWDLHPKGEGQPNLTDIFQVLGAGTTTMNSTVLMNLNYRERFVVLWDKTIALGFMGAAANGESCVHIKKYKKVNLSVTYNNTGAGIANIATGALYLVSLGDSVTPNFPKGVGVVRIRYSDA